MSNETQSLLLCTKERWRRRRIEKWKKGIEKEEKEIRWRRGSSYIDDPWVAVKYW